MRSGDYTLILASYYPKNTERTKAFCQQFLNCKKIVVYNSSDVRLSDFDNSWTALRGSNHAGEFSAWQEGLDWSLENSQKPKHGYIFVNDTVNSHRKFTRIRFHFLKSCIKQNTKHAVGFTDELHERETFSIYGLSGDRWMSTYCFYLGNEAIEKIDFKVNSELVHQQRGETVDDSIFPSSMSNNLKKRLEEWLFGGGWYKSKQCVENYSDVAKFKARAIVNEKMLSLRLLNKGIEIHSAMNQAPRLFVRLDNFLEKLHTKKNG